MSSFWLNFHHWLHWKLSKCSQRWKLRQIDDISVSVRDRVTMELYCLQRHNNRYFMCFLSLPDRRSSSPPYSREHLIVATTPTNASRMRMLFTATRHLQCTTGTWRICAPSSRTITVSWNSMPSPWIPWASIRRVRVWRGMQTCSDPHDWHSTRAYTHRWMISYSVIQSFDRS